MIDPHRGPRILVLASSRIRRSLNVHIALVGVCCLLYTGLWGTAISSSQTATQHNLGPTDGDVVVPQVRAVLGQIDESASAFLAAHLLAAGGIPWTGLQGTGTLTYGSQITGHEATLLMSGADKFRLDVQTPAGPTSTRIYGGVSAFQAADGKQSMLPLNSDQTGLFQFQLPRLREFPQSTASLIDLGMTTVGGRALRRISYQFAPKGTASAVAAKAAVIDLYFDPSSQLLAKSASLVSVPDARNVKALRVVSYSDYRRVSGVMIPFHFIVSLGGELEWTLRLTAAQVTAPPDSQSFEF